jgi:peptidoglycan/LPS O-acetylase OafA/YrhL
MGQIASRANNFGLLRVALAVMVVICHACVLLDGSKLHEPLFFLTHTVSLGDVAVDGFFLISGYLVLQSLNNSRSGLEFIGKRFLRIYPGYIVACVGSLFLGFASGGSLPRLNASLVFDSVFRVVYLDDVSMDHAFVGVPTQGLNGSLWSIAYEFRCYILLMFVAALGLTRSKKLMTALVLSLLMWAIWLDGSHQSFALSFLLGTAVMNARTFSLFGVGCLFYLLRETIPLRGLYAGASALLLAVLLPFRHLDLFAIAVFGGYLLFWLALKARTASWSKLANKTDLSYAIYLYGWPVTCLIIWYRHEDINRWLLSALSIAAAAFIAFVSWTLVEKPALSLKSLFVRRPTMDAELISNIR